MKAIKAIKNTRRRCSLIDNQTKVGTKIIKINKERELLVYGHKFKLFDITESWLTE